MSEKEKMRDEKRIKVWNPDEIFGTYDQMFQDFRRSLMEAWSKSPLTESDYWERSLLPRVIQKPPVNLIDHGNSFEVVAEVPGFNKKDIDIELTENSIDVTGRIEKTKDVSDENYRLSEIRKKNFRRSIRFPDKVVPNKGKANMVDGLLKVTVPKETPTTKEKKHKIEIQ
jgi:HSP20 family protein